MNLFSISEKCEKIRRPLVGLNSTLTPKADLRSPSAHVAPMDPYPSDGQWVPLQHLHNHDRDTFMRL